MTDSGDQRRENQALGERRRNDERSCELGHALAVLLLAAARPLVRRSRALGDRLSVGGRRVHAATGEFLGGLKLVKSGNTEARHVRDFSAAIADMRRGQLAFIWVNAAARAVFNVGGAATIAALVWLAVRHAGWRCPNCW